MVGGTGGMRRGLLAGSLALAIGVGSAGAQTPEEIFERGNAAYQEERYADAAEAYHTLLRYRIRDPRVEYNLGNAEFKLGRLGPAILHYERALRLDPTDADIRDNLGYVRDFLFDRLETPQENPVLRAARHGQDWLGPDRQAWCVLLGVWCLFGLLAWGLSKPGRWKAGHGWALAAVFAFVLLGAGSWYTTFQRLLGTPVAVVVAEAVEVRAGPGDNNPALFTVHEGLTIEVRDERPEWLQVSLPNGLHGWIPSGSVERV